VTFVNGQLLLRFLRLGVVDVFTEMRAADVEDESVEVDVFPTEAEDLAGPQTQQHGNEDHGADVERQFFVFK
jgi:hypothetical protein